MLRIFEHKSHPFLPTRIFMRRWARWLLLASSIMASSLALGSLGYHYTEGMSWLDATLNAAMILTGMGPVNELKTELGKLFAICYALFSGVVFLTVMALVFAPIVHRLLHHFHLESRPG